MKIEVLQATVPGNPPEMLSKRAWRIAGVENEKILTQR